MSQDLSLRAQITEAVSRTLPCHFTSMHDDCSKLHGGNQHFADCPARYRDEVVAAVMGILETAALDPGYSWVNLGPLCPEPETIPVEENSTKMATLVPSEQFIAVAAIRRMAEQLTGVPFGETPPSESNEPLDPADLAEDVYLTTDGVVVFNHGRGWMHPLSFKDFVGQAAYQELLKRTRRPSLYPEDKSYEV